MDKKRLTEMLKQHGVKVIGNYVRKDDLRKVLNRQYVKAGPGAGVNVEFKGSIDWKEKNDTIVFKPSKVFVKFMSYYNEKGSEEPGLGLELDAITDADEVSAFKYRMGEGGGTLDLQYGHSNVYEQDKNRQLTLSGGYMRSTQKVGDTFDFAILLDKEYYLFATGTAKFLDSGRDAWEDLDAPESDDE